MLLSTRRADERFPSYRLRRPRRRRTIILMIGRLANGIAALALVAGCASAPSGGARAPSFSGVDTQGRPVSLAAYRDKVLILDFWALW